MVPVKNMAFLVITCLCLKNGKRALAACRRARLLLSQKDGGLFEEGCVRLLETWTTVLVGGEVAWLSNVLPATFCISYSKHIIKIIKNYKKRDVSWSTGLIRKVTKFFKAVFSIKVPWNIRVPPEVDRGLVSSGGWHGAR